MTDEQLKQIAKDLYLGKLKLEFPIYLKIRYISEALKQAYLAGRKEQVEVDAEIARNRFTLKSWNIKVRMAGEEISEAIRTQKIGE